MFKTLTSLAKSRNTSKIINAGLDTMKQHHEPLAAKLFLGSSIAGAIVAIVTSTWFISDCVRFQTEPGQCDEKVEKNAGVFVMGVLTLLGSWGGFNTLNPGLVRETNKQKKEEPAIVPVFDTEPSVEPAPEFPIEEAVIELSKLPDTTQKEIAERLDISVYRVRKVLKEAGEKAKQKSKAAAPAPRARVKARTTSSKS